MGIAAGAFPRLPRGLDVLGRELGGEHPIVGRGLLDDGRLHRTTLGLVAVEQPRSGPPVQDRGQLPAQVDGVADAGVEAVAAERRVEVRGVSREHHPPPAGVVDELHARGPGVDRQDGRVGARADRAVDEDPGRALTAVALDAEGDHPPRALAVDRAHQPGAVRLSTQYWTAGPWGTRPSSPGARNTMPKFGRSACSPT